MAGISVGEAYQRSIQRQGYKTEVGSFQQEPGVDRLVGEAGVQGFLLFGPYLLLPEGAYTVTFHLTADRLSDPEPALRIDVCAREGHRIVADRTLPSAQLGPDGRVALAFEIDSAEFVEFRVFTFGRGRTSLIGSPVVAILAENREPSILDLLGPQIQLRLSNSVALRAWLSHGATFRGSQSDLVVTLRGLSFHLEQQEDFQLVTEVLFNNEYGVMASGDKIVIDVGMNIGLASLYFATLPSVVEIHSFEPFSIPYRRACRNLGLNPALARKITLSQCGLTDRNETVEVQISPDETIGTSIKGVLNGVPEFIRLRSAPDVLGPLLHQGRGRNLLVVLKLDCEGSEFAIMESLEASQLLPLVDIIMMEWHKWWSAAKTQLDLIRPLLSKDFVVFDRTSILNPHAGMVYAVRRSIGGNA